MKYYLSKTVEILDGKMVSTREGKEVYADEVGRIMRMKTDDGGALIQMLDM